MQLLTDINGENSVNKSAMHLASGKVREIYALDCKRLVIITTDRVSAYDVILNDSIPDKSRVLTQLSIFWMKNLADIVPNHLITATDENVAALPRELGQPTWLKGRTMIVRQAEMFPLECIVRGYLAGSAWREYSTRGKAVGLNLPAGLQLAEKLPQPAFTPSTKTTEGHDQNLEIEEARNLVGDVIDELARISIELYCRAAAYAEQKGIIIADTKFEFGLVDGEITLADEVITPDSSRFWYVRDWTPGTNPPSLDKQIIRDWLDSIGWDHTPPPPRLSSEVIQAARTRYIEAYEVLTENRLSENSG